METIFCKALKDELIKTVRGHVSVRIEDDMLVVDIATKGNPSYRFTKNSVATELLYGLCAYDLKRTICKDYEYYILKRYFKRKK